MDQAEPHPKLCDASDSGLPAGGTELDLRDLRCPMPVLRTRKHLKRMQPGATVSVLCTDPLAGLDIPHLLHETGDVLLAKHSDGDVQVFIIRKRS